MMITDGDLSEADGLFVLETTDGDAFLGWLEFINHTVVVHNGFVGRPPIVEQDDVLSIIPAQDHPDVFLPSDRDITDGVELPVWWK